VGALRWACFGRTGHPAWSQWDTTQWAAWVPHFSTVAPLLAQSNLLAALPLAALVDVMGVYQLRVQPLPFAIAPVAHMLAWSARHANDAAVLWLRTQVETVWQVMLQRADALAATVSASLTSHSDSTF